MRCRDIVNPSKFHAGNALQKGGIFEDFRVFKSQIPPKAQAFAHHCGSAFQGCQRAKPS